MAMTAGTASVTATGVVTGDGMARAIVDAKVAAFADSLPTDPTALAAVYAGLAADANATAAAIVTYLKANAVPVVSGTNGTLT